MITRTHILAGIGLFLLGCLVGREWRDRSADLAESRREVKQLAGQVEAVQEVRKVEQAQSRAQQVAGDKADEQKGKIDADYDARLAAAGTGADYGRLNRLWAQCETQLLSNRAAAAAAIAEQDRLRRESAARIVRDVESAQAERDEVVDRYGALGGEG